MFRGGDQSIEDDPSRYRKYIDYWTWLEASDRILLFGLGPVKICSKNLDSVREVRSR